MTTSQPARASSTAIGRPIESIRPAPVTTATLPSRPVSSRPLITRNLAIAPRDLVESAPHRKVLDAAVHVGAEPRDRAGHLEGLEPHDQVPQHGLELDAAHVRAHTEVRTEPERQVRVRVAIDLERERFLE